MKQKLVKTIVAVVVCFFIVSAPSYAQSLDLSDLMDMSLDDLLNMETTVASGNKSLTAREAPGIVTLITADEIQNSGARDLIDVLRLVPGFTFGVDVEGVVGVAMRGNWAHEGKMLLLIDGQEFNELAFSTLQFGNHFPLDIIQRIEIIRGPGSAMYGGFAELGVINIITKNAEALNGVAYSATYSYMKRSYGSRNVHLSFGTTTDDLAFTSALFYGQGIHSDREFSDFYGETYPMKIGNTLRPLLFNTSLTYKKLSLRFILDHYETLERDIFYVNAPFAVQTDFLSYFFEAKYKFDVNEKITLTPKFNYKQQKPWYADAPEVHALLADDIDEVHAGLDSDETVERYTGTLTLSYDLTEDHNITAGLEFYEDKAKDNTGFPSFEGKSEIDYNNLAAFAQGLFKTSLANITVGGRYDKHSKIGNSFVPRVGITKVVDKFHTKLLYSKAFRAPGIHNIADFQDRTGSGKDTVEAENTTVLELEAGYQVTGNLFVTANLFDISIKDPIVYYYDGGDRYANYEKTGTRGIEIESRYKDKWGYVNASYSYYKINDNKVDQYAVRDADDNIIDEDMMLGFPDHKVTVNSSVKLTDNVSINPSLIYLGKKYGYAAVNEDDVLLVKKFGANWLLNVYIKCDNVITQDFTVGFGVSNILDEDTFFIQPYYDGYHAPFPGAPREFFIKCSYRV